MTEDGFTLSGGSTCETVSIRHTDPTVPDAKYSKRLSCCPQISCREDERFTIGLLNSKRTQDVGRSGEVLMQLMEEVCVAEGTEVRLTQTNP